ncbi:unnamed protein product [Adineta steineri]|uniref:Uncharacterized protein n=1 Tax=Adineta steineri TaxID=433720 RepID=A0A815XUM4_9BILA|nr:unnamed protein product [Adineta steineri]CAF1561752.1 unnamed protein product [Adineta steineri]
MFTFKDYIKFDKVLSKDIERIDNNRNRCNVSPYQCTKTGHAGKQRSSMLHSALRLLSELGNSHRRGHKLHL